MRKNKMHQKMRSNALESIGKTLKTALLAAAIFALTISATASTQNTLDKVDPNFNVQVRTNSFSTKFVAVLKVLPDNKILASGHFNTYNGQTIGGLIRLHADGSLDTTFNNNLLTPFSFPNNIAVQSDGKIIISGLSLTLNGQTEPAAPVLRLNPDGGIDPSFNYTLGSSPNGIAVDASGRIVLNGFFQVLENGAAASRFLIRLNADGTHDETLKFQSSVSVERIAAQNNKIIIAQGASINTQISYSVSRLNENGTLDNSFTRTQLQLNHPFREILIQPDKKVLVLTDGRLYRLNENGNEDAGFQTYSFPRQPRNINLAADGKITVGYGNSPSEGYKIIRVLPNGAPDPSFNIYTYLTYIPGSTAVQSDGSVLIGDNNPGFGSPIGGNGFIRLLPSGLADSGFNVGGTGFQNVSPGSIRAIAVQNDDKILIAGKFDSVGGVPRSKIARLNSDTTLDSTFQLNMTAAGNYFSIINDIYTVRFQADGKIILTGNFVYFLNGVQKYNMVRLNPDGSIDASFNLLVNVTDFFGASGGGQNRLAFQTDGKIFVGMSRGGNPGTTPAIRLNANGSADNSFTATTYNEKNVVYIMDTAIQPDGKILIGGRYVNQSVGGASGVVKNFLARLNGDGSRDETFQVPEEEGKEISVFKLLADGKILTAKLDGVYATSNRSVVHRLNADGSIDTSFGAGVGANGRINALVVLPDGKIMLGGKFSAFNNQPRANLAKLKADGSLDATVYAVNQEVLSLTLDNQERILVGGNFTTISTGDGENVSRAYAARLISSQETTRTRFDFDGDGRADFAVYEPATGFWSTYGGSGHPAIGRFGANGDRAAPADFDGDGKTDRAVFRPSEGNWYLLQSTAGFSAIRWGTPDDKPAAGDYEGDGKADVAVWRPSNGVWYILQSSDNKLSAVQFGQSGDIVLPGVDFDGDKRADIAVFRPSNGVFYWLASGSNNQFRAVQFGATGDVPAVADYNGDGKADLAVFRPANGVWYQYLTTPTGDYTFAAAGFGQNGDVPVPADYNGDGKADIAVRRGAVWHLSLSNQSYQAVTFGDANARAVAAIDNQ